MTTSTSVDPVYHGLKYAEHGWMKDAACKGLPTEWFFIDRAGSAADLEIVRRVCDRCPVREQCLEYAVRNGIVHGFWGGLSVKARRKHARRFSNRA